MSDAKLDDLNARVTNAIFRAEDDDRSGRDSRDSWFLVSTVEAEIAAHMPASSVEGDIARIGAITAALSARAPRRAVELANAYLREDLSEEMRVEIDALAREAATAVACDVCNRRNAP